jgi:hypothetical protein
VFVPPNTLGSTATKCVPVEESREKCFKEKSEVHAAYVTTLPPTHGEENMDGFIALYILVIA